MARKIFISYRREDTQADARNVRDRLARAFGAGKVFMDVDDLKPGQRFEEELSKAITQCDVFLPIIGRRWLELLAERRASGSADFVQQEIASALQREMIIIPVLVEHAPLPDSKELPEAIRGLVSQQALVLTYRRFGGDVRELVDSIKKHRKSARRRAGNGLAYWLTWSAAAALLAGALGLHFVAPTQMANLVRIFASQSQALSPEELVPGRTFRDCPTCPEMVVIPAGSFLMGSPDDEPDRNPSEGPQRRVTIAKPLAVGKYEVTVRQFEEFVAATSGVADGGGCAVWTAYGHRFDKERSFRTPSFSQLPTNPVVCVSWPAAVTFANWLTTLTGKKYRLPSEAEWEYAARANSSTRYHFGNDERKLCEYANAADRTSAFLWGNHLCSDGVGVQTAEVGRYKPNAFGLHDTMGNVWEWVQDCAQPNYQGAPGDSRPLQRGDCNNRGIRGGSWDNDTKGLRSAARAASSLQLAKDTIGFRVVREID